jgi:hypothetical protein
VAAAMQYSAVWEDEAETKTSVDITLRTDTSDSNNHKDIANHHYSVSVQSGPLVFSESELMLKELGRIPWTRDHPVAESVIPEVRFKHTIPVDERTKAFLVIMGPYVNGTCINSRQLISRMLPPFASLLRCQLMLQLLRIKWHWVVSSPSTSVSTKGFISRTTVPWSLHSPDAENSVKQM